MKRPMTDLCADMSTGLPGIMLGLSAATALFAEVLELYQLTFRLYEDTDAGADTEMDSEVTCWRYRRRWKEITGMEVPE